MTDNVVSLGKAAIHSDRRDQFAQSVAEAFEAYVAKTGHEPDAVAFIMGGIKQQSVTSWDVHGESEQGVISFLSMSALHLSAAAMDGRQGL